MLSARCRNCLGVRDWFEYINPSRSISSLLYPHIFSLVYQNQPLTSRFSACSNFFSKMLKMKSDAAVFGKTTAQVGHT
jgi:hypothetical protein